MRDPRTPAEWQEAVNGAKFFMVLDVARQYGLIECGPRVDAARRVAILSRGRKRGYHPVPFEELVEIYLSREDAVPSTCHGIEDQPEGTR